jgi:FkbM family methyltransferase
MYCSLDARAFEALEDSVSACTRVARGSVRVVTTALGPPAASTLTAPTTRGELTATLRETGTPGSVGGMSRPFQTMVRSVARAYTRHTPLLRGRGRVMALAERYAAQSAREVVTTVKHAGRMALDLSETVERSLFYLNAFEPEVTAALRRVLRPGAVAVDVGAHVGYMTLVMARAVGPSGRVVAIEPTPKNRRRLLRNLALNDREAVHGPNVPGDGLGKISVDGRAAVGSDRGSQRLRVVTVIEGDGGSTLLLEGAERLPEWARGETEETEVPGATLDRILADHGVLRVDAIKMDIEGCELRALEGAESTIRRSGRPPLVIEVNPRCLAAHSTTPRDLLGWLETRGYRVRPVGPHARSTAHRLAAEGRTYNALATAVD